MAVKFAEKFGSETGGCRKLMKAPKSCGWPAEDGNAEDRKMLRMVKKQIKELLATLMEAEQEVRDRIALQNLPELMNVLADIQDAAIAVGGKIEESEGLGEGCRSDRFEEEAVRTVAILERYCELIWEITQEQEADAQLALAAEAWKTLGETDESLERIPVQKAIVFMPYKASMWDSLESVWLAACRDPECVPFVVPIPYFDLKDGQITARHYEGEKFPDYVPIVHYSEFPLEEMHPEAVFIHNPFDDCNTVTTVLPQFYSGELKKACDRVIYIPYFITGDGVYMTHRYFPSYERVDFIVTQCEKTIDSFAAELPREKFLPYGSPIADRVLRLEKEKPEIPEEWKAQLKNGRDFGGDRTVMLNTSITMLMGQRERFLNKIEYLMDLAKQQKGISLVWRPHPLLEATAKNMGEEYARRLACLEDKFLREKIGVLDKNPDVGVTVALCDAYLGETASSVLHMFGIAGKPRFYTNVRIWNDDPGRNCDSPVCDGENDIREEAGDICCHEVEELNGMCCHGTEKADGACCHGTEKAGDTCCHEVEELNGMCCHGMEKADGAEWHEDDGSRMFASARCRAGGKAYYVLDRTGWIVSKEEGAENYVPIVRIPGRENVWGVAYRGIEMKESSLWLYPENAQEIFIYNVKTGRMRKLYALEESGCDGRNRNRQGTVPGEFFRYIEVDEECLSVIRAEKFKRGNREHVWYEGENSRPEDFFRFLRTAEEKELTGTLGAYPTWLSNLDGTCGEKVLQAVKESL